jgi:hypothetical protein
LDSFCFFSDFANTLPTRIMRNIMRQFTKVPMTLYRIQPTMPVRLRDYDHQAALILKSFDLKLKDGNTATFDGPNGMTLLPLGKNLLSIVENFKGKTSLYRLDKGRELPTGLVLFHEHTDHYSLQTSEQITKKEFDEKLTDLLESCPVQTKDEFLAYVDELYDQDN